MNKIITIYVDPEKAHFIADARELPGVMATGSSKQLAIRNVKVLALRVLAEQLENRELDGNLAGVIFTVED